MPVGAAEMVDLAKHNPWKRGPNVTTWVTVEVWSELAFEYKRLRWQIPNDEIPPVSNPPLLYVRSVETY